LDVDSDENIEKALERLSSVRVEAAELRARMDQDEDKIEEALLVVDMRQRNVEQHTARLALLEDEIGDISVALFGRGVLDVFK
jgi:hypothetical protein